MTTGDLVTVLYEKSSTKMKGLCTASHPAESLRRLGCAHQGMLKKLLKVINILTVNSVNQKNS